jgi:hypothetical protein
VGSTQGTCLWAKGYVGAKPECVALLAPSNRPLSAPHDVPRWLEVSLLVSGLAILVAGEPGLLANTLFHAL